MSKEQINKLIKNLMLKNIALEQMAEDSLNTLSDIAIYKRAIYENEKTIAFYNNLLKNMK